MLIDYATTYPNTMLRYNAIDMILHVDPDIAYLTIPEARSFYAGHFYLGGLHSPSPIKPNPERNGPIHTESKITQKDVSSAAEGETCGTLNNRKTLIGMRPYLTALHHKQPSEPFKTVFFRQKAL